MTAIVIAERDTDYLVFDTKDVVGLRAFRRKTEDDVRPGDIADDDPRLPNRPGRFNLDMIFAYGGAPKWIAKVNLPPTAILGEHIILPPDVVITPGQVAL